MTMVLDVFSQVSMSVQVETGSSMHSVLSGGNPARDVSHLAAGSGVSLSIQGQSLIGVQLRRVNQAFITDQISHLCVMEAAGIAEGPAADGADMLFELACLAGFRCPMTGIVNPWGELVGQKRPV